MHPFEVVGCFDTAAYLVAATDPVVLVENYLVFVAVAAAWLLVGVGTAADDDSEAQSLDAAVAVAARSAIVGTNSAVVRAGNVYADVAVECADEADEDEDVRMEMVVEPV